MGKNRKNIMNEIVKEEVKATEHRWKCANTPGQYVCHCGATGLWNRSLQKIEVEFPMPYELMKSRHLALLQREILAKKGVEIVGENM